MDAGRWEQAVDAYLLPALGDGWRAAQGRLVRGPVGWTAQTMQPLPPLRQRPSFQVEVIVWLLAVPVTDTYTCSQRLDGVFPEPDAVTGYEEEAGELNRADPHPVAWEDEILQRIRAVIALGPDEARAALARNGSRPVPTNPHRHPPPKPGLIKKYSSSTGTREDQNLLINAGCGGGVGWGGGHSLSRGRTRCPRRPA
ncbi:hypothetical protein [Micromonospora craniellae]|uniref:hypothetical protein n=1 Tax=Micromonospora craniellae TaxID=2294034 RepID=UPI0011C0FCF8|nr:hypothetical protein [Micromonospora craniellae]QOC93767.1 hypothetical protein ID554_09110 [Micromonospora craniellae]